MWGFEASALAFIQFSGTLASMRELIAEAGGLLGQIVSVLLGFPLAS